MRKTIIKAKQLFKIPHCSTSFSKNIIIEATNHLKNIAQKQGLASLSSVQVGYNNSVFIILKSNLLKKNKWKGYKSKQLDYNLFINPEITHYSIEQQQVWQECCSFPRLKLLMLRSKSILVKYINSAKKKEDIEQQKKNFQSILFQHQIDHLKCLNSIKNAKDISLIQVNQKNIKIQEQLQQLFRKYALQKDKLLQIFQRNKIPTTIHTINVDMIENKDERAIAIDIKINMDLKLRQLLNLIEYQIIDPYLDE